MPAEQCKNVSEITLHKDEALLRVILDKCLKDSVKVDSKSQNQENIVDFDKLKDLLLAVDGIVVNLDPYDKDIIEDINRGHWDIYRHSDSNENTTTLSFEGSLVARSPILDVKDDVVVAIDFGTKSTVAGLIDNKNQKQLIRIGGGNYKNNHTKNDYENPTIVEFSDLCSFLEDYNSVKSRPLTSWDDVCVSHSAANHLAECDNENFYRFFSKLKQWARLKNTKIRIKDKHKPYTLPDFLDCNSKENDINPIEIYAYYIGRYINNMTRGVHLNYLLSYPVKYEKAVKEKIKESFERGLKKSIPNAVITSDKKINIDMKTSEPAGYAISALKEYGFKPPRMKKGIVCYGIFDFGGGTTDFDFGMWEIIESRRYDFRITHFGAGGDSTLGGENLLELLAYEIFKDNKEIMRQSEMSFVKPELGEDFGGSEGLIADSREARKNMAILVEFIRPFWENLGVENATEIKEIQEIMSGKIKPQLINNNSQLNPVELEINAEKLVGILKKQIANGVENFFHTFKMVSDKMKLKDSFNGKLCIFLGGNASRSTLVKECFENYIKNEFKEDVRDEFEIFPALGTKEAEEKKKEMGIEIDFDDDISRQITCKTGVVFGMLDTRKGGKIEVISEISADDEAKFEYYLGYEKYDKFNMLINRDDEKFNNGEWCEIADYADEQTILLYYTSEARASNPDKKMNIHEVSSKKLELDKEYGETDRVMIKRVGVNSFVYEVFDNHGNQLSSINKEVILK